MNLTRHIGRILGALIVMIALCGASSAAFAHAGHDQAPAVEQSLSADDQASTEAIGFHGRELAWTAAEADFPAKKRCMGGCCSSASGHACCGFSVPVALHTELPVDMSIVRVFSNPPLRDGLQPEALRKPPRSFA